MAKSKGADMIAITLGIMAIVCVAFIAACIGCDENIYDGRGEDL